MSQTAQTLIMMAQSNNLSSRNLKLAYQNTTTSQMHFGSNFAPAKRHNYNTDTTTGVKKLSYNPSMTLQNRSNNKTDTHYISQSDIIPNMRLDFIV